MTIGTVVFGVPGHLLSAVQPDLRLALFYMGLALVTLVTLRYYLAVAVKVVDTSPESVMKMRPVARRWMFFSLCILTMLDGLTLRVLGAISVEWAYLMCAAMALIAFLAHVIFTTTAELDGARENVRSQIFGFPDLILFVVYILSWNSMADEITSDTVVGVGVAIGVTALLLGFQLANTFRSLQEYVDSLTRTLYPD